MRKYAYIVALALITGTLIFTSCRRMEQMMDPMMPDAEMIEPPEVGDANALLKYLTIEGATVVNAPLPETSIAQTAPRIQADVTEINASPGGIVSLPFAYSGTNALAGCIVCIEIEGVPGYFNLPYTGAPDDLPSAISVGLPPDVELGTFEVCYSVYDDQGQYSNYLRTVINVKEITDVMPGEGNEGLGIFDCAILPGHGLRAEAFYPGTDLTQLPDFDALTPFLTWSVACIDVPERSYTEGFPALGLEVLENFAIRLRGQLKVETAGTHNFTISSDDGSKLYIGGDLIIDHDGLHGMSARQGNVILTTGYHDVEIQYFQGPRAHIGLQWSWQPPGSAQAIVPPEVLYPPGTGEVSIEPMVEVVNIDRTDPNALPNRLTIEGGTLVSARLPETSTAATAPRLQADITEVNASPGGTIFLPFEYSGANALAGCIVCIEGVPGYYDLPYTGAADALPTAIPVGLSINLELGTFEVCYSVYDDQGQYGNFLTAVINVEEITDDLIPDTNLAAAVRETLGLPADALLTAEVLATLEDLNAPGREIVDLTGLEHAMNLRSLNLGWDSDNNQISDVSPLANLTKLTNLNLYGNQVSDISPLANLTKLTNLNLVNNQVSDISPLANLTKLTNLGLQNNPVSDISVLENLTQLTELNLFNPQVSDISVLENLTQLTNLSLLSSQLSDISPLANLTKLKTLNLAVGQFSDISPLANLTKLTNLWLQNTQVSDISPLANLTKLTNLYLRNNQVSDISVLENLTQLTFLDLGQNQVSDISVLENLTQLTNLNLRNNQVSDISVLENLTQLTHLNLGQNQVSDISPLVANTGLDSGDTVYLQNNPLNAAAINTHIPALQARGVTVEH